MARRRQNEQCRMVAAMVLVALGLWASAGATFRPSVQKVLALEGRARSPMRELTVRRVMARGLQTRSPAVRRVPSRGDQWCTIISETRRGLHKSSEGIFDRRGAMIAEKVNKAEALHCNSPTCSQPARILQQAKEPRNTRNTRKEASAGLSLPRIPCIRRSGESGRGVGKSQRPTQRSRCGSRKAALLCRGDTGKKHAERMEQQATTNEAQVKVDAGDVVRTVDARLFGINAVMWDSYFDTPGTLAALRELDVQALRFPGGSPADDYHWQVNRNGRNVWKWATPFSSFISIATNLPAHVFITVNYGSGTPEEAAAWVRCANITNHCGFKYWEIGNENYGAWEHDENSPPHDPVTYARRAKEFFRQMKAADPTIKIGVVITEDYRDRASVLLDALAQMHIGTFLKEGYLGWTPKMLATLKQLGVTPDFVICHRYPAGLSGGENDAELLQSTPPMDGGRSGRAAAVADLFRRRAHERGSALHGE